jgi:hypothetical protein
MGCELQAVHPSLDLPSPSIHISGTFGTEGVNTVEPLMKDRPNIFKRAPLSPAL